MANVIKKSFSRSLKLLPFSFLSRLRHQSLLLPLYHLVSNDRVPHVINLFEYKNVNQFEEDLDFLQSHYTPVSLTELVDSIKLKRKLPPKAFLLSFDDGYREIIDVIAPILKRRSIPALFFLNTAFIDNKEMFFRNKASLLVEKIGNQMDSKIREQITAVFMKHKIQGVDIQANIRSIKYQDRNILDELGLAMNVDFEKYLRENKPYLSSVEVAGLVKDGFAIGSHSINHPLFQLLSLEEQLTQVKESLKVLREQFSMPINSFAFPFNETGVSKAFYDQTHFNGTIDVSFGTGGFRRGYCDNNLQRQSMEVGKNSAEKIYRELYRQEIIKGKGG